MLSAVVVCCCSLLLFSFVAVVLTLFVSHGEHSWCPIAPSFDVSFSFLTVLIYTTKNEHVAANELEYSKMLSLSDALNTFTQANQLMEEQKINIDANIEEYRSTLEAIDIKIPTLEGQKKRAVASKNFKSCKSIVAEIKSLNESKTTMNQSLEEAREEMNELIVTMHQKEEAMEVQKQELTALQTTTNVNVLERVRVVRGMLRKTKHKVRKAKCQLSESVSP